MNGPAICAKCRHHARGKAIAVRTEALTRRAGGKIRSGIRGGDHVCAREGLTTANPDPVTGFVGRPSGPDCRDMNPTGECEYYSPGFPWPRLALAAVICLVIVLASRAAIEIASILHG